MGSRPLKVGTDNHEAVSTRATPAWKVILPNASYYACFEHKLLQSFSKLVLITVCDKTSSTLTRVYCTKSCCAYKERKFESVKSFVCVNNKGFF